MGTGRVTARSWEPMPGPGKQRPTRDTDPGVSLPGTRGSRSEGTRGVWLASRPWGPCHQATRGSLPLQKPGARAQGRTKPRATINPVTWPPISYFSG